MLLVAQNFFESDLKIVAKKNVLLVAQNIFEFGLKIAAKKNVLPVAHFFVSISVNIRVDSRFTKICPVCFTIIKIFVH